MLFIITYSSLISLYSSHGSTGFQNLRIVAVLQKTHEMIYHIIVLAQQCLMFLFEHRIICIISLFLRRQCALQYFRTLPYSPERLYSVVPRPVAYILMANDWLFLEHTTGEHLVGAVELNHPSCFGSHHKKVGSYIIVE
jgi:hypothetical protein